MFKLFKRFDFLLAAAMVVHLVALSAMHKQARQARQALLEESRQAIRAQKAAQKAALRAQHAALKEARLSLESDLGAVREEFHALRGKAARGKAAHEAWERGEPERRRKMLAVYAKHGAEPPPELLPDGDKKE